MTTYKPLKCLGLSIHSPLLFFFFFLFVFFLFYLLGIHTLKAHYIRGLWQSSKPAIVSGLLSSHDKRDNRNRFARHHNHRIILPPVKRQSHAFPSSRPSRPKQPSFSFFFSIQTSIFQDTLMVQHKAIMSTLTPSIKPHTPKVHYILIKMNGGFIVLG